MAEWTVKFIVMNQRAGAVYSVKAYLINRENQLIIYLKNNYQYKIIKINYQE